MSDDPTKSAAKGAIEAIYKPIESIVKTLAGPAAEEIGLTFRDSVKVLRFKRQARLFKRVEEICAETAIKPQAVKLSLLFDIVDKASLEEDDDLQELWAQLLANAANPKHDALISTAFPDILKQISKEEAIFLEDLYLHGKSAASTYVMVREPANSPVSKAVLSSSSGRPAVSLVHQDNLTRLGLIKLIEVEPLPGFSKRLTESLMSGYRQGQQWTLTALGSAFVKACTNAKKQPTVRN
ncbi:MAG: Abi-alpha family protein [Candidatus Angelobacter sp.]